MQLLYSSISRWNFLRVAGSPIIERIGSWGLGSHLCFGTPGAGLCAFAEAAASARNAAKASVVRFIRESSWPSLLRRGRGDRRQGGEQVLLRAPALDHFHHLGAKRPLRHRAVRLRARKDG